MDLSRSLVGHVTLRQLQIFDAVATLRSVSRAAKSLHLTQPAVSIQLRHLSELVGTPLVESSGRGIALTAMGRVVHRYAREVIEKLHEADLAIQGLRGSASTTLRVAAISAGNYFLPHLLAQHCERYPAVVPQLVIDNRANVLSQLRERHVDLAVMGRPPEDAEFVAHEIAPHPYVLVAAPTHRLAGKPSVRVSALLDEPFVVREDGSDTLATMKEVLGAQWPRLKIRMQVRGNATVKQAVIAGMGVSFLSGHTIGLEVQSGRLVVLDVAGFPVWRHWHVVHVQGHHLDEAAGAFRAFLVAEGARRITEAVGRIPELAR